MTRSAHKGWYEEQKALALSDPQHLFRLRRLSDSTDQIEEWKRGAARGVVYHLVHLPGEPSGPLPSVYSDARWLRVTQALSDEGVKLELDADSEIWRFVQAPTSQPQSAAPPTDAP